MDWNTIAIVITLVMCFLGLAGWLATRDRKISNDGEWKGSINTKLDMILGINDKVDRIESDVRNHEGRLCRFEGWAESTDKRLDELNRNV